MLSALVFGASVLVAPVTVIVPATAMAVECGPGVGGPYNRPGGYCDSAQGKGSLTGPVPPGEVVICDTVQIDLFLLKAKPGERIRVAQPAEPEPWWCEPPSTD